MQKSKRKQGIKKITSSTVWHRFLPKYSTTIYNPLKFLNFFLVKKNKWKIRRNAELPISVRCGQVFYRKTRNWGPKALWIKDPISPWLTRVFGPPDLKRAFWFCGKEAVISRHTDRKKWLRTTNFLATERMYPFYKDSGGLKLYDIFHIFIEEILVT